MVWQGKAWQGSPVLVAGLFHALCYNAHMSSEPDKDDVTNRIFKAGFPSIDPAILARIQEIAATDTAALSSDPKVLADDLQTVAALALQTHENVEMLIQLIQQISKVGSLNVTLPETRPKRPPRF